MVETSTAVATPSTTAARMRNGRISAGIAITKARPISAPVARLRTTRSSSPERNQATIAERQRQHGRRQQAAGEQRRDRHARDRADHDQHDARRNRLGHRAGRGEQRDELARLHAARLHLGKQHRARPPPCRPPWRPKCRTPGTSRRAAHRTARRARGRAARRGTPPWRAPCRSCRSGCRERRTAGSTAAAGATCPRPCG